MSDYSDELDKEYDELVEGNNTALSSQKRLETIEEKDYNMFSDSVELSMRDSRTRHFIREIIKWCGLYHPVQVGAEKTLHAEGRRSVGWQIKEALDSVDPMLYPNLLIEGVKHEKALYESE